MYSLISPQKPVLVSSAPLLALLLQNRVCAGFPSPAEDLGAFQDNYMTILSSVHDTRDNAARQAKEVRLHLNLF